MSVDLHIHTYFSDGTLSPEEVVAEAYEKGIQYISVCDHNTIGAHERCEAACNQLGVTLIKGVEIDASYENGAQHILAYSCDFTNKEMLTLLHEHIEIMEQLSVNLIEKMSKDYDFLSLAEYTKYKRVLDNGGWKGIDYLKSKGFHITYPECMKFYKDYHCEMEKPFYHVKEVCNIIKNAGGYAVLAHPFDRLNGQNLMEDLVTLKE